MTATTALAVVVALGAAGCGGDDRPAPADDTPTPGTDAAGETSDTPTDDGTEADPGEADDATAATGGDVELPEGWPEGMPVSSEATLVSAGDEAGYLQVVADVPQSLEDVVMYYEIIFDQRGWTVESEAVGDDGAMWEVAGNGFGTSRVVLDGQGDSTRVTIDLYPEDAS